MDTCPSIVCSLQGIITLIMATDMAHHDTLLKRFRKQLDAFSFDTPEDKKLVWLTSS